MELVRLKEQAQDLYETYRTVWFVSGIIFLSGLVIAIAGFLIPGNSGEIIAVIGASICVGSAVGVVCGLLLGRPIGWVLGLLVSLFTAVYIGYSIGGAVGAFTSSYFAPPVGIIIGWWAGKKKGY